MSKCFPSSRWFCGGGGWSKGKELLWGRNSVCKGAEVGNCDFQILLERLCERRLRGDPVMEMRLEQGGRTRSRRNLNARLRTRYHFTGTR